MKQIKDGLTVTGFWVLFLALMWIWISSIIFSFRHPWMTRTEQMLHIREVVTLRTIPYSERQNWYN